jgi:hypothetical protein
MHKLLILAATIAATLGLSVATAAATPKPTPNLKCGAYNMVQAWPGGGANVPDGGGMQHAMTVNSTNNTNGNDGMSTAVNNTAC